MKICNYMLVFITYLLLTYFTLIFVKHIPEIVLVIVIWIRRFLSFVYFILRLTLLFVSPLLLLLSSLFVALCSLHLQLFICPILVLWSKYLTFTQIFIDVIFLKILRLCSLFLFGILLLHLFQRLLFKNKKKKCKKKSK